METTTRTSDLHDPMYRDRIARALYIGNDDEFGPAEVRATEWDTGQVPPEVAEDYREQADRHIRFYFRHGERTHEMRVSPAAGTTDYLPPFLICADSDEAAVAQLTEFATAWPSDLQISLYRRGESQPIAVQSGLEVDEVAR